MGLFLNPDNRAFKTAIDSEIYVDKTGLIEFTNKVLGTQQAFICNSRPRRFGKSITANMLPIIARAVIRRSFLPDWLSKKVLRIKSSSINMMLSILMCNGAARKQAVPKKRLPLFRRCLWRSCVRPMVNIYRKR